MLPLIARARTLGVSMALATAGLGVVAIAPASATDSATTWHVQAGNADDPTFTSTAHEVLTFYNAQTVVHPGDKVLFTPVGGHTVTFNPIRIAGVPTFAYGDPGFPAGPTGNTLQFANRPGGALLNSGLFADAPPPGAPPPPPGSPPPPPTTFTLNIGADAAGTTYQFFCMFHREMAGTITVMPTGSKLPSTDAKNQTRAQRAMAADLARGRRALAAANRNAEDNPVAAGLGVVSVQGQGFGSDSILRFAPTTLTIGAGESVTFFNEDVNAPHTVTFGEEIVIPPGPPGSPPPPPPGFFPYGGTTITSPSAQVNSGFLLSQELVDYINAAGSLIPPGFIIRRGATFTFPNAGTYHYICALHDFVGMQGDIIVRAED